MPLTDKMNDTHLPMIEDGGALPTATLGTVWEALAPNTRRAYRTHLTALGAGLTGTLSDRTLSDYLARRFSDGDSPATLQLIASAAAWFARACGQPTPRGQLTAATLRTCGRNGAGRGRGQASPLSYADVIAMQATANAPKRTAAAEARSTVDAALAGVLFMAGLRRSEAAALAWDAVEFTSEGALIAVRQSKTNQHGADADVRFVKDGAADALLRLYEARTPQPEDRVFGGLSARTINRRVQRLAREAGISRERLSAHSARVGLASELVRRGASSVDVMDAGGWKTERMVAHYAAGARAENGAVARYL